MTEKDKAAISAAITALQSAKKSLKTVSKPTASIKEAGKAIDKIIKMLSDSGPGVC